MAFSGKIECSKVKLIDDFFVNEVVSMTEIFDIADFDHTWIL
jgi:hypothetical protein